jgi:hypothetical protein
MSIFNYFSNTAQRASAPAHKCNPRHSPSGEAFYFFTLDGEINHKVEICFADRGAAGAASIKRKIERTRYNRSAKPDV